ncbi:MAG: DUF4294 domain-containing protein [Flavobacteriales bacterium]|nr:DUF4294 domain-containing protein [Flavobacteriales bacterium]MCB9193849.1 DUF4294 domain-containing protein [Flavobacteriales bacterium]
MLIRDRHLLFLLFAGLGTQPLPAQDPVVGQVVRASVHDGDTLLIVDLPITRVDGQMSRRMRRELEQRTRLMHNIQKVYPYARITAQLLQEYAADMAKIDRPGDKELYIKLAEAELKAEFSDEVEDMTISQGRLLIKLIDRETGNTSYELVKQLRGGFEAFVWQGVARLFGNDLKDQYDPAGEDKFTELIVQRIERGELAVIPREPRTEKAQARLERRRARLYRKYGLPYEPTSAN